MRLDVKIEALLFSTAEPLSARELTRLLEASEGEIREALHTLEEGLKERGIRLLRIEDSVTLGTAPEISDILEKIRKEDLSKDLGKAALETLTIILYRAPIVKSNIDYIRGVNSSFILRNLLIRGLIEREQNPNDQRSFLYRPTFDLLSYLGITNVEKLPEWGTVREEFRNFEESFKAKEQGE